MSVKTFAATDESLAPALAFVEEEMDAMECSMKMVMQVTVCVEEMFVNVAHYAYGDETGDVTMTVENRDGELYISFVDTGMEFDPLAKEDPDITLAAEDRNIGGLGIYMVKKTMDSVSYERKDGQNIFAMTKRIS